MLKFTRREFLQMGTKLAVLTGLGTSSIPQIVDALQDLSSPRAPVLWIQGQSCSGCSVSFLNTEHPNPLELLTQYISLKFNSTLSTATGYDGMNVINQTIDAGEYLLVVEGSVPAGMPKACVIGGEYMTDQLVRAARRAKAVISLGTCAAFGGIPAAENNPTGAVSVPSYLKRMNVVKPMISIPGCPAHPDWFVGTLVHVLKFGVPKLDPQKRPQMFFSRSNHDTCPRFSDYERENFAKTFSEEGCLFQLGCIGPNTFADCSLRNWNSGTNSCIKSGSPCIGCASENFARKASFPFYRKGEQQNQQEIKE